ncbi:glycogen debranching enzyme [Purpureocillium lavendulum]|uniref:Glycogen debranching enzyme n=1 Tax=Purpureocillium lavendulum TaxID=1247861 RepID=A0AB34FAZ2_9HYPO|nr:glycogen debranching enzyme [Purpureocillium lavendulum]
MTQTATIQQPSSPLCSQPPPLYETIAFNFNRDADRYRTKFDNETFVHAKEWLPEQYLICPPRVLGYILQEKQWAQLHISSLNWLEQKDGEDAWKLRLGLADDDDSDKERRDKRGWPSKLGAGAVS